MCSLATQWRGIADPWQHLRRQLARLTLVSNTPLVAAQLLTIPPASHNLAGREIQRH